MSWSIVDVISDAEVTLVEDLRPGDCIFDFYGGRHELSDVKVFTTHVATIRRDGHLDRWDRRSTIAAAVKTRLENDNVINHG